jgi:2-polyprenyl-6-methoxyphenol hydroxylase-like FAD-dependent oxidoreductase
MFDAIVVGARCGGSPTAMLLARRGYRVLSVDRATFPSDTISTHFIWTPGVACLKRWGLLDRLSSTNCPASCAVGLDLGASSVGVSTRDG